MVKTITDGFFLVIAILLFLGGVAIIYEQITKERKAISDLMLGICYIIISIIIFVAWIKNM